MAFVGHQEVTMVRPSRHRDLVPSTGGKSEVNTGFGVLVLLIFFNTVVGTQGLDMLRPWCLAAFSAVSVYVDPGSRPYDSS